MWLENIETLSEMNIVSIIVKLVLALILGGLLGLEREHKQRPAGLRTYVLVCIGSTLACIANIYMFREGMTGDAARIPAQVISGIGFLGAGTIIVTRKHQIKGLTTAAGLWCCAAIGIAIGSGLYSGAILSSILIVVALKLLGIVDKKLSQKIIYLYIYAEYESGSFIRELIQYSKKNYYKLSDIETTGRKIEDIKSITFSLKINSCDNKEKVIDDIENLKGCILVELM